MHSIRVACPEALRKKCGAVGRDVDGLARPPARRLTAESELDFALKNGEHLLEVGAVGAGAAARRDVHVDEAVAPGRVFARQQDRVGVSHQPDVRQVRVVRPGDRETPLGVIRRERRAVFWILRAIVHGVSFNIEWLGLRW
jgi:hypothetical protein